MLDMGFCRPPRLWFLVGKETWEWGYDYLHGGLRCPELLLGHYLADERRNRKTKKHGRGKNRRILLGFWHLILGGVVAKSVDKDVPKKKVKRAGRAV